MRKPSRQMPPAPMRTATLAGWLGLGIVGTFFISLMWVFPIVLAPIAAVVVATICVTVAHRRYLARLAADRQGESICTFARSFDYRAIDTWIIRAVFEELQPYCRFGRYMLPLRGTDDLDGDLRIDPDELDDLAADIAYRAGRSMDETTGNPLYGKVGTVADLVLFFVHQPKRAVA
jgi:hypothetical protein